MPNIKSQEKRDRQNIKSRTKNRALKTKIRNIQKIFLQAVEEKDVEAAKKNLSLLYKALDKAAKNSAVHDNFVANKKSQAAKKMALLKS
ncbi:MAG: 30S ribosomal protein S20 [Actinomycetota bacterium]|jgi:small subunit ribosomal protein S20|nr:30S ribosomal protein S20 [Actinomycetota bacterium]